MDFRCVICTTFVFACQVAGVFGRPNIVIILADDLGWNDVSFHGSNQIPTPNIDALAYNGVILNSHYVPALCTPSRASLLTGKYPTSMGMQHLVILAPEPWGLPLEETLMPEYFRRHGYATHAIGKWHLGFYKKEYTPTFRGFDTHFGYWNGYQDYYDHTMEDGTLEGAPRPLKGYDMRRGMDVDYASRGIYSTDAFTDEAVNIIKSHNSTRGPLFLYLAHLSPHSGNPDKPFQAPDEEIAKHAHIKDPERRVYAAMVTRLDDGVGKVVAALREADMLENSIVLFLSDNGAVTFGVHSNRGSNYPLRGLKESPWEGGVRGVAAVWSPLLNRTRRVSNQLMHVSDWLPTLYSAAGLDKGELGEIDGIDQWEALSHDGESRRTEVFNNYDEIENYSSLRVGTWKYVEGTAQAGDVDLWYGESGEEVNVGYDVSDVMNSRSGTAIMGHLTDKQPKGCEVFGENDRVPFLITREEILKLRKESVITCDRSLFRSEPREGNFTEEMKDAIEEVKRRIIRDAEETSFSYPLGDGSERGELDDTTHQEDSDEIFGCDPLKTVCLFNLELDPCERFNLAKIFPDVVESLQRRLRVLKEKVAKPLNMPGDRSSDPSLHNGTWANWRDRQPNGNVLLDAFPPHRDFVFVLMDNAILKIVFSPVLLVFNELAQLFLPEVNSYASVAVIALLTLCSILAYNYIKRFSLSGVDGNGKEFSSSPFRRVSSRSVER